MHTGQSVQRSTPFGCGVARAGGRVGAPPEDGSGGEDVRSWRKDPLPGERGDFE